MTYAPSGESDQPTHPHSLFSPCCHPEEVSDQIQIQILFIVRGFTTR